MTLLIIPYSHYFSKYQLNLTLLDIFIHIFNKPNYIINNTRLPTFFNLIKQHMFIFYKQ